MVGDDRKGGRCPKLMLSASTINPWSLAMLRFGRNVVYGRLKDISRCLWNLEWLDDGIGLAGEESCASSLADLRLHLLNRPQPLGQNNSGAARILAWPLDLVCAARFPAPLIIYLLHRQIWVLKSVESLRSTRPMPLVRQCVRTNLSKRWGSTYHKCASISVWRPQGCFLYPSTYQ